MFPRSPAVESVTIIVIGTDFRPEIRPANRLPVEKLIERFVLIILRVFGIIFRAQTAIQTHESALENERRRLRFPGGTVVNAANDISRGR